MVTAMHASNNAGLETGPEDPRLDIVPDRRAYVVAFDDNDPARPMNWSPKRRHLIAFIVCFATFVATFDSALFAPGAAQASENFSVDEEVGYLGTSLFVLGFAAGPLLFAPLSELKGRFWPMLVGMFGGAVFSVASATSKDIQTLIICRFFGGVFGASPLTVAPAVLSDIYDNLHRGTAISVYALAVMGGPLSAPFIGGFISTDNHLRWRWTLYLPAIMGFFDVALILAFLKETYGPVILTAKAARVRRQTGNWMLHAQQEEIDFDPKDLIRKFFTRPIRMLITEPIVLFVTLYMSFIYSVVYAFLGAYSFIFEEIYGMSSGVAGLPLIAVLIGVALAVIAVILHRRHMFQTVSSDGQDPPPEAHLFLPIIGAPVFALGLFW